jgi:hypothetical protein
MEKREGGYYDVGWVSDVGMAEYLRNIVAGLSGTTSHNSGVCRYRATKVTYINYTGFSSRVTRALEAWHALHHTWAKL